MIPVVFILQTITYLVEACYERIEKRGYWVARSVANQAQGMVALVRRYHEAGGEVSQREMRRLEDLDGKLFTILDSCHKGIDAVNAPRTGENL